MSTSRRAASPYTTDSPAIVASLIGLFALGYWKGKVVSVSPIKSALEILIIGGIATSVGIIVGNILEV